MRKKRSKYGDLITEAKDGECGALSLRVAIEALPANPCPEPCRLLGWTAQEESSREHH